VKAVLTLNYDWFFEGGGTQKYNADRFKPMASPNSKLEPGKLHVYHLHGYVPHGIRRKPKYDLVLTAESSQRADRTSTTFARSTIDKFLRCHPTLFLGTSFDDEPLLKRIEVLSRKGAPRHFAILKKRTIKRERLNRLRAAGVEIILCDRFEEIPSLLAKVYRASMSAMDRCVPIIKSGGRIVVQRVPPKDYWAMLLFNKD
jgi:hypothetical protein